MRQEFTLRGGGSSDKELTIVVSDENGTLSICPNGYGDHDSEDGYGCPLYLEIWDGRLRVVAFPDINVESPTVIDLESALETNRKDEEMPEPIEVSLLPTLTSAQSTELETVIKEKGHLEYLCFMMLRRLNQTCNLKQLLKLGVQRDIVDAGMVEEFFGDLDKSDNAGCCEAENHTIPSLLDAWEETTEKMMKLMSGHA
jgi:hypothetical protein